MDIKKEIRKPWLIPSVATALIGGGIGGIVLAIGIKLIIPGVIGGGLIAGGFVLKYFQKEIEDKYGDIVKRTEMILETAGFDEEKVKEIIKDVLGELIEESTHIEIPEIEMRK